MAEDRTGRPIKRGDTVALTARVADVIEGTEVRNLILVPGHGGPADGTPIVVSSSCVVLASEPPAPFVITQTTKPEAES